MEETPLDAIIAAANYIFERVKLNIQKAQNTNEEYLIPRFVALLKKLEKILSADYSPSIIYIEDKKFLTSGLCDKFRSICWLYTFSKLLKRNFKIYLEYPFNLSDYLIENKHKWLINREDIINDRTEKIAVICKQFGEYRGIDFENIEKMLVPFNNFAQTICDLTNNYPRITRILCYLHAGVVAYVHFREAFFELFRPSQKLQDNIDKNLKKIDTEFSAAQFRFQKLLGDFNDDDSSPEPLDDEQKSDLIQRCINVLQKIAEHNGGLKILVCSDSAAFLKAVKNLDFVFVVDGGENRVKHICMDAQDIDNESVLKLFTDLFLMSHARIIYKVIEGGMYGGNFAKTSAMLGQTQYWIVKNGVFEIQNL